MNRRILLIAGVAAIVALYLPALVEHASLARSPYIFNDDARQYVPPYFGGAFDADYASAYYRARLPIGFNTLYAVGGDPESLSKWIPYLLLAIVLAFVAAAAYELAGAAGALLSVALLLSSPVVLERATGGTPRAFAFPVVAAAIYGLVARKRLLIAAATVGGAAFYPPAGILAGVALVLASLPAQKGELLRRAAFVGGTAALAAIVLLPPMLRVRAYGASIGARDAAAFPEAGAAGRYTGADRPPFAPAWRAAVRALQDGVRNGERPFVPLPAPVRNGLLVLALCGAFALRGARWLFALAAVAVLLYVVSAAAAPLLFIPERYVAYSLPLLPAILIPAAAAALARATKRAVVGIVAGALLFALLGGFASGRAGLTLDASRDAALFEALAKLPPSTVLAGWPTGPVGTAPYLSRRPALVAYETHQAFHAGATAAMRRRMLALIEAYFASSPEPLVRLREEHGVTHLLVDRRHFSGAPPRYFAPFDEATRAAAMRLRGARPEVARQSRAAAVLTYGPYVLLDLRRIP